MFAPAGVLLAHLFVTFPYMLGAVKPVLDELEGTYEEAAYTIGASRWQTFRWVILPALRGGLFTGALLTFAHSLGEFGATVMVSGQPAAEDPDRSPLHLRAVRSRQHRRRERGRGGARGAVVRHLLLPPALHAAAGALKRLRCRSLELLTQALRRASAMVDRVSLEVATESCSCCSAPRGSGKSTILRMIAGLARPDDGRDPARRPRRDGPAAAGARRRLRLPELLDLSPHDDGREHRVRPADPRRADEPSAPTGARSCSISSASAGSAAATRTSSRAASSSGSRSPGRSPTSRPSFCSTSLSARSTSRSARSCGRTSRRSSDRSASRRSS